MSDARFREEIEEYFYLSDFCIKGISEHLLNDQPDVEAIQRVLFFLSGHLFNILQRNNFDIASTVPGVTDQELYKKGYTAGYADAVIDMRKKEAAEREEVIKRFDTKT